MVQESEDTSQEAEKVSGPQNMMKREMMDRKDNSRRMINVCAFPVVSTIEANPCSVTPRKWCFAAAERSASTATATLPSVPFLKPMGKDSPDASSR